MQFAEVVQRWLVMTNPTEALVDDYGWQIIIRAIIATDEAPYPVVGHTVILRDADGSDEGIISMATTLSPPWPPSMWHVGTLDLVGTIFENNVLSATPVAPTPNAP